MATYREAWRQGADHLQGGGVETPLLDSEILLRYLAGKSREEFYRDLGEPLPAALLARFTELLAERARGVPVAYLTGTKEFFGLEFKVTPAVLIPRPETEVLVERALELARLRELPPQPCILDIGTGSGAIAVALAVHLPEAAVVATDISAAALAVARENAVRHKVEERINFRQGDLWEALAPGGGDSLGLLFDLVVSNPPYIPEPELEKLSPEVKREPRLALAGGLDGLNFYRRLAAGVSTYLAPGGWVLLEVGQGQAAAVGALLAQIGLAVFPPCRDLAGRERVVQGRLGSREV